MTTYSRHDVLRILQISTRQLQGWERAGLFPSQQSYSFKDLGQLRILRILRQEALPAASIRDSIVAMKAVSGMVNPLLEASPVRAGNRLAFRHHGAIVDPIRRQLLFDFERADAPSPSSEPYPLRQGSPFRQRDIQECFLAAVQAEESGEKQRAMDLYEEIIQIDPDYAPAHINLGTIYFHLRQFGRAEELYRCATEADPSYVLAFFDLGNVLDELGRLDESISAYHRAIELAPRYADAHYNLALAHEHRGDSRHALRHWQAYVGLDGDGPWANHARDQIRKLLDGEKLTIAWRAEGFTCRTQRTAMLTLVQPTSL